MKLPALKNFYLVGGTALALKFGHRVSVDLDLFSFEKLNQEEITSALQKVFAEKFVYFDDAEQSVEPRSLNQQSWENVKKQIQKAVRDYLS